MVRRTNLFLVCFSLLFVFTSASIRLMDIQVEKNPDMYLITLDEFDFTETGRVELNLSYIHINVSNPSPNLTLTGFFLIDPSYESLYNNESRPEVCYLTNSYSVVKTIYTLDQLEGRENVNIVFEINNSSYTNGGYELVFQNCFHQNFQVSMHVRSAMYNLLPDGRRSYLSASKTTDIPYFIMLLLIYLLLVGFIIRFHNNTMIMRTRIRFHNTTLRTRIVLLSTSLKAIGVLCQLLHSVYIRDTGNVQGYLSVFFTFMSAFCEEIPLFILLLLFFNGWWFKIFFRIAILLQVIATIWEFVVLGFVPPCDALGGYLIYHMATFLIFYFASFPHHVIYAGHLLLGGFADGRAAINLSMVDILQSTLVAIYKYIFLKLFIVVVFESFGHWWFFTYLSKVALLRELAALSLFCFIAYKIRQFETHNLSTQISDEDEEAALVTLKHRIVDGHYLALL